MKIGLQCYDCIIKQFVKIIDKQKLEDNAKENLLKELIQMLISGETNRAAPIIVKGMYNKLHETIGNNDPYREIKKQSNDFALKLVDRLRNFITASNDKFLNSLRLSIAGNILDHGAPGGKNIDHIEDFLKETSTYELDMELVKQLKNDIEQANKILFIGDNAGEIVFDMVYIEQLPSSKITYCTRGYPIINDITIEDTRYVGLDKIVKVISTGDNTPGIDFNCVSAEFKDAFQNSDMVILKGQGNFETLADKNISQYTKKKIPLYFLFKVKCEHVSRQIGKDFGSVQIVRKL